MDHNLQAGKNFIWLTIGQVLTSILGLVFFIFLSHTLGSKGLGQYSFITSFVALWFLLVDLGVGQYLYREWVKKTNTIKKIKRDYHVLFTTRIIVFVIIFLPFFFSSFLYNREILRSLIIYFFANFLSVTLNVIDLYLKSKNLFKFTAFRQILEKVIMTMLGIFILFFYPNIEILFWLYLVTQIASFVYYYFTVWPFIPKFVFDMDRSLELLRKGIPFMLMVVISSIYYRIDMIMLRYLKEFQVVGWYSTAYKFIDTSLILPYLFLSSIFPIIANLFYTRGRKRAFHSFFFQSLRIFFSFCFLLSFCLFIYAPLLIAWLFPPEFFPSVLALRILAFTIGFSSLSMFFNNVLIIQNKEKLGLGIILFSAILNIVLNLFLIPRFSLYGSAWATAVSEVIYVFLLQHFTAWERDRALIAKMGLIILINLFGVFLLKTNGCLNNYFISTTMLGGNIGLLIWLKLLQYEDIKLFINPLILKIKGTI
jgi:O-antigen/teichoic acid export membrane protein